MSETRKDLIASLIFFLMGIGVLLSAAFIKDPGLSGMGPGKFPDFIGICMILLSAALFTKTAYVMWKQKPEGGHKNSACAGQDSREDSREDTKNEWRAVLIAGICLLYALTFTVLGYFVSTFLAITFICLLFREKRIWVYPLLYVVAGIIWLGFTYLLSIRLP